MELVSVQHDFEYTAKDGRLVSIKPNESYILVSRTNEHWWHVRKDLHTRPFYVPAQYVKELPTITEHSSDKMDSPVTKPLEMNDIRRRKGTTVIRVWDLDAPRETYRFSTFGQCEKIQDVKPCETLEGPISSSFAHREDDIQTQDSTEGLSSTPEPLNTDILELYAKHHHVPKVKTVPKEPLLEGEVIQQQTFLQDEDMDFPSPPKSPLYDTIPKLNIPECDTFSELPGPIDSDDTFVFEEQHLNLTEEATSCPNEAPTEQVENECLRSAVYVNVSQLRKSISESPPSAPSSYSPSSLDPEGWEVHVDQESGQEYFYHPATGRTTWDSPFLDSPTDPEPPCFPSPPQSPALSPSSPPAWTSDWEQLVDESSGQPYFYNAMSGETSWEPPEQLSPYPPVMEPMSVHRFHEDGPPPLPDEDYPLENNPAAAHPESSEDLLAMGHPTLPKEYTLSHAGRTIIPRANLDRSTPNGWNLNVQPNGTWVFTSEHSPEQWVKSVDEQGQTYYYLRDGSKSMWNLPEVPVGHYRMENGVEADNPSVIKNWRHTMGPAQMSAAHDDGRVMPTHKRNTSDYSSDSSSTGNSPETQHDVQNLEKAGILNKTKVCDNGKKVRKNWAQTWTVLHGGVLTFHKDPKSAAIGTSIKTNQFVPEITVDLRGATIGWAPKDKSSKKNVLELKGKNGVEFLVQYDTESIIHDWHKVLVDTIRQLEYQDHHSEDEDGDLYEKIGGTERDDKLGGGIDKRRPSKLTITHSSSGAGDSDQKRVRTKLMKFLMKRPTLQSVKEKGYIRDNVFGCHLGTLCAQERATVPSFVEKCIKAVEKRGLDIDGLYRVSGNLAVIQKLRFKADHEELDLEDGQWEDVHVITGALKLFFRELPEPLFPFSHFNKFIEAIRIPDYNTKASCMYELVRSLPPSNHDTMKLLFGHLRRLIEYGEENRMTVQNVAIVFGPTLLRPEMELGNITMHMVFQNQIVEFILNEYQLMFYSS
ncbi:rho GTPase-activating protein 27-like isoform X2 [Pseudochaenichthys georgianus]|uniref:rho GTPase-activating protein 27-like isoform X2 n=1 Tax=Pseudochaenichthys georgianus TaxID=52239 RepID=UPI00146F853D|nr:rho GTPase-activating protein 27-like isoform X2 [Pseudochaenichthys georgianus]